MNRDTSQQPEQTENGQKQDDAFIRKVVRESARSAPKISPDLFARIEENINETTASSKQLAGSFRNRLQNWLYGWRDILFKPQVGWGLAAAQAVVLCLFLAFSPGPGEKAYQTLSSPDQVQKQQTSIDLYVMFRDQATIGEIEELLNSLQGRIKDGPAGNGVYLIAFAGQTVPDPDYLVKKLQQSKIITFVEQVY